MGIEFKSILSEKSVLDLDIMSYIRESLNNAIGIASLFYVLFWRFGYVVVIESGYATRDFYTNDLKIVHYISIKKQTLTEQERAERAFPDHHPETALVNYRAGREVWDTNGDVW